MKAAPSEFTDQPAATAGFPLLRALREHPVQMLRPLMALMQAGNAYSVFFGQLGFVLLLGSYGAVNPIALCEIFPRNVRCSAVSTAYNIAFGVAGGTAPALATWLITVTDQPLVPALYIMVGAIISAIAALSVQGTSTQAISDSRTELAAESG